MSSETEPASSTAPNSDDLVQEPKKTKGVVGERVWGPYKTHAGTRMSEKFAGGPWGLGDPEDTSLRVVEKNILITNMIKKKANATWCQAVNEGFFNCAAQYGMLRMTWKCRDRARLLRECVTDVLNDPARVDEVTQEYLDMRAEYRRTGKRKLLKRM